MSADPRDHPSLRVPHARPRPRLLALGAALLLAGCAAQQAEDPEVVAARENDRIHAALVARHDRDGDRRISAAEYGREPSAFAHLDRDGDAVVTRADLDVPTTMPADLTAPMLLVRAFGVQGQDGVTHEQLEAGFATCDTDADGRLARSEFLALPALQGGAADIDRFATLLAAADRPPAGDGDGVLALAELTGYLARRDSDGDGRLVRRERLLPGREPEIGWFQRGSRELAPDFTATAVEGQRPVSLESLRGQPVALIFGSFT